MAQAAPETQRVTVGRYLANRLRDAGCSHIFAVAGDYNLTLLDCMSNVPGLKMVYTCSELGAGYAADGFARFKGVGAAVTTLGVGGMSAVNAAAGCYAEDLPVIFVNGGINSNDLAGSTHVLHHTTGLPGDYGQQLRAYREVTCVQAVVQHVSQAQEQIDHVISQALAHRKPGYLEICCNLATLCHPSLVHPSPPLPLPARPRAPGALEAALGAAAAALRGAASPLILVGPRVLRAGAGAASALIKVVEASGLPVVVTADARSAIPEDHEQMVGTYWAGISSPGVMAAVMAADVVLACGVVSTDYSTLGYASMLSPDKTIDVQEGRVTVQGGPTYACTGGMEDFLSALASRTEPNPGPLEVIRRRQPKQAGPGVGATTFAAAEGPAGAEASEQGAEAQAEAEPAPAGDGAAGGGEEGTAAGGGAGAGGAGGGGNDAPLSVMALGRELEGYVDKDSLLIADTGEAWFIALNMALPPGCRSEVQMRYGSIGWSVGAALGMSLAAQAEGKRVVLLVGDGAFQMTAVEISTMLRFGANPVVVLLNNGRYVIEEEIHSGQGYNTLQPWDYTGLARALHNGRGRLAVSVAATPGQLRGALAAAGADAGALAFVECKLSPDDCNVELLEFGARVAKANSRPPQQAG